MDVRFRGSKNQRLIDVQKSLNACYAVELGSMKMRRLLNAGGALFMD